MFGRISRIEGNRNFHTSIYCPNIHNGYVVLEISVNLKIKEYGKIKKGNDTKFVSLHQDHYEIM